MSDERGANAVTKKENKKEHEDKKGKMRVCGSGAFKI